MQRDAGVLALDQRFAVVFDGDGLVGPAEARQQIGDCRAVVEFDRRAIGGDGDQASLDQDFAAASFAAAFFCAL